VVAGVAHVPSIQVTARDPAGNQATGFTGMVTLGIGNNPGGATLSGSLTQSAVSGVATFAGISLDKVGVGYTLTAASAGLPTATSGTFRVTPASATHVGFTVQPTSTPAGDPITPAVKVTAFDQFDNVSTQYTGNITVAIGANPGASTLSGTLTVAAVSGVSTFSTLSLDRASPGYTLTASAASLTGDTSTMFEITPSNASRLVFTVQPTNSVAGVAFSPDLRVEARDTSGNLDVSFNGMVSLSIGNNPGSATLMGTPMVMATGGVAVFTGISLDHQGSGYRLNATGTGVSSVVSNPFNVTPGAAAKLAVSQQPTLTVAGQPITPAVQIAVEDNFGNRVPTFTGNVSIALQANPGGGTLGGTTTVAAVSGVVSFSNLTIDRAATGYTLRATSTGLTMVDTVAFDVISGSASAIAFTVQPTDSVAGVAFSPAVVVTVRDTQGNTDPTFAGNITLSITNPGAASLAGTISVLVANGTATFNNVSIDKVGIDYTLSASAAGVPAATSATFDITPAPASTYVQTGLPANVAAASTQAVVFTAQDQFGNVATDYDGTANLTSTDPDFEGPATVTFTDGIAPSANLVFHTMGTQMVTITDATTASITATFDTNVTAVDAPTVRITAPTDGSEVGGPMVQITANGTVASAATVMKIEIFVDGTMIQEGTSLPFTATWDATGMPIGSSHTLQARLTDSEGNIAESAEVHVTISDAADDGCCSAGGDPTSPLALAGFVLAAVLVRRRRRLAN
jgi:MYXO-CTERM domain-containing protein